jgi:predicted 2-oxoglutarate/Fe(II)-dependent dioxygenase YbiX
MYYLDCDEHLQRLTKQFSNKIDIMEFLRGIAYNLLYQWAHLLREP